MAFATAVAFWAQARFPQVSLNFFLIVVVGYMFKDRIKEGLRRILQPLRRRATCYDRTTRHRRPGDEADVWASAKRRSTTAPRCRCPRRSSALRRSDDFITVSQGELSRDGDPLPEADRARLRDAAAAERRVRTGVTDIIRLNVDRLLRDMDDPESALEYVDLEDFSVGTVKARQELPGRPRVPLHGRRGGHRSAESSSWCGWCWTATASSATGPSSRRAARDVPPRPAPYSTAA